LVSDYLSCFLMMVLSFIFDRLVRCVFSLVLNSCEGCMLILVRYGRFCVVVCSIYLVLFRVLFMGVRLGYVMGLIS